MLDHFKTDFFQLNLKIISNQTYIFELQKNIEFLENFGIYIDKIGKK